MSVCFADTDDVYSNFIQLQKIRNNQDIHYEEESKINSGMYKQWNIT